MGWYHRPRPRSTAAFCSLVLIGKVSGMMPDTFILCIIDGMQSFSFHDLVLGGQDGLVNTLGIMLGLVAANARVHIILVAVIAAAFSEAVSMGGVAYTSALPINAREQRFHPRLLERAFSVGTYALIGSFIPIIPLLFFAPRPAAAFALVISASILFCLGVFRARQSREGQFRAGMQMLLIGMFCALAGFLAGTILK